MYPNPQDVVPLPPRPNLDQYKKQAKDLASACKSHGRDGVREWAQRWLPDYGNGFVEFASSKLLGTGRCALNDAQFVIARAYGFLSWPKFAKHIGDLQLTDSPTRAFESAADAIIAGDAKTLQRLLRKEPKLIRARSTREHRSTLLHYVAANGVENYRQKTPKNIVQVTELLLDAGDEVDAIADMYGGNSTALGLAATSIHPLKAGVQLALIDLLLEHGAQIDLSGGAGRNVSIVNGCLANGRGEAAEHLAMRGARLDLESAAGVGRLDVVEQFFNADGKLKPTATEEQMRRGFGWACQFGRTANVNFLLNHGMDAGAMLHGETGLHWAAFGGHLAIVELLLQRHASLDLVDERFDATPLSWALYAWGTDPPSPRDRYYAVVERLVAAGATVKPEWLEHPTIRADARMIQSLTRSQRSG